MRAYLSRSPLPLPSPDPSAAGHALLIASVTPLLVADLVYSMRLLMSTSSSRLSEVYATAFDQLWSTQEDSRIKSAIRGLRPSPYIKRAAYSLLLSRKP